MRLSGVPLKGAFEPSGFEPGQYYFGSNPTDFGVGQVDVLASGFFTSDLKITKSGGDTLISARNYTIKCDRLSIADY